MDYGDLFLKEYYPVNEQCKDILSARKLCMEVKDLCAKYNANFYFVIDGASCTNNNGNPAVHVARQAVAEWERNNGFDDVEDWRNDPSDMSNYKLRR